MNSFQQLLFLLLTLCCNVCNSQCESNPLITPFFMEDVTTAAVVNEQNFCSFFKTTAWFKVSFLINRIGMYTVSTEGSTIRDTVLEVNGLVNGCTTLVNLGCNDDSDETGSTSKLKLNITTATEISVFVGAYDSSSPDADENIVITINSDSDTRQPTKRPVKVRPINTRRPTKSPKPKRPSPTSKPTSLAPSQFPTSSPSTDDCLEFQFPTFNRLPFTFRGTIPITTKLRSFLPTCSTSSRKGLAYKLVMRETKKLGFSIFGNGVLDLRRGNCFGESIACGDSFEVSVVANETLTLVIFPPSVFFRVNILDVTNRKEYATCDFTSFIDLGDSFSISVKGTTAFANILANHHSCLTTDPLKTKTMIYKYTIPARGWYSFNTYKTVPIIKDTVISVRSVDNCLELGCNDDAFSRLSEIKLFLVERSSVYIFVTDFHVGGVVDYILNINSMDSASPTKRPTISWLPSETECSNYVDITLGQKLVLDNYSGIVRRRKLFCSLSSSFTREIRYVPLSLGTIQIKIISLSEFGSVLFEGRQGSCKSHPLFCFGPSVNANERTNIVTVASFEPIYILVTGYGGQKVDFSIEVVNVVTLTPTSSPQKLCYEVITTGTVYNSEITRNENSFLTCDSYLPSRLYLFRPVETTDYLIQTDPVVNIEVKKTCIKHYCNSQEECLDENEVEIGCSNSGIAQVFLEADTQYIILFSGKYTNFKFHVNPKFTWNDLLLTPNLETLTPNSLLVVNSASKTLHETVLMTPVPQYNRVSLGSLKFFQVYRFESFGAFRLEFQSKIPLQVFVTDNGEEMIWSLFSNSQHTILLRNVIYIVIFFTTQNPIWYSLKMVRASSLSTPAPTSLFSCDLVTEIPSTIPAQIQFTSDSSLDRFVTPKCSNPTLKRFGTALLSKSFTFTPLVSTAFVIRFNHANESSFFEVYGKNDCPELTQIKGCAKSKFEVELMKNQEIRIIAYTTASTFESGFLGIDYVVDPGLITLSPTKTPTARCRVTSLNDTGIFRMTPTISSSQLSCQVMTINYFSYFSFVPPISRAYVFDTLGMPLNIDTVIDVTPGLSCSNSQNSLSCNDDVSLTEVRSRVVVYLESLRPFIIAVGSTSSSTIVLTIT